ncbi:MAG: hypothetical protein H7096_12110 [Flavobacterium sp.]|nr:hypothetical protein [Pedobacter sp.]
MTDWLIQGKFKYWAIVNFIVLAFFGVLLRYMQLYSLPGVKYFYLLHAHSHFAFAGWMFLSIALLLAHSLNSEKYSGAFKVVFITTLISAFGMLISFSLQGYKPVSIAFSTLFILATYYFSYVIIKNREFKIRLNETSRILLFAALFLLCLSSLGPFALASLQMAGVRSSTVYKNAIYFYLHFQINGFMLLASLGIFATFYLQPVINKNVRLWLYVFVVSVIPVYFIFTLWAKPDNWIWILAALGTCFNLFSWIRLSLFFSKAGVKLTFLVRMALFAITLKLIFQVLICIPAIGEWAFFNRNLVIGYIHLLTLGCITPLILDQFIIRGLFVMGKNLIMVNRLYFLAVFFYLFILFLQPFLQLFSVSISYFPFLLLLVSLFLLVIGILYLKMLFKRGY